MHVPTLTPRTTHSCKFNLIYKTESAPPSRVTTHHVTVLLSMFCVHIGPSLDQYVQDMGELLFPMHGIHGIGQRTIVDEGIEKGLMSAGNSLLALPSSGEDNEVEDLGSVDSISHESESDETPFDSDEVVAEETTAGESDEVLSDDVLDESMDLF